MVPPPDEDTKRHFWMRSLLTTPCCTSIGQKRLNVWMDATAKFLLPTEAFSCIDDKIDTLRKPNGARLFRHTPWQPPGTSEDPPVPTVVFTSKDALFPQDPGALDDFNPGALSDFNFSFNPCPDPSAAVSYTHLTLPTIYSV